jgi:hypothetical protein
VLEDGLDAQGGMEELGLRGAAGVAALGPTVADATALLGAARQAVTQAAALDQSGAIVCWSEAPQAAASQAAFG